MLIELSGLPGSGKSTFARELSMHTGLPVVSVMGKKEILYWNAQYMFRHPLRFLRYAILVLPNLAPGGMRYEKFVNLFLVANAKYAKAAAGGGGIIDQGHAQSVVSLFEREIPERCLPHFLRAFPPVDRLCFFAYPEDIRAERMKTRGYGVRERLDRDALERWKAASESNTRRFLAAIHGDPTIPFVAISDDCGLEGARRKLAGKPHLVYVLDGRMPTAKAHGHQTAEMCAAFADAGALVDLWYAYRMENRPNVALFDYYGVKDNFTAKQLPNSDFVRLPPRLRFYGNRIAFVLTLFFARWPSGAIGYTRKPEVAWTLKQKGAKVVYECHDWFGRGKTFQLALVRGVDIIVTTNRFIKEEFVKNGFAEKRIVVAPNGVDLAVFATDIPAEEARQTLWKTHPELPEEWKKKRVLLYTGSLTTMRVDKGIADILKALRILNDPDAVFLAVGGDERDIARYREEANKAGVLERVRFLGRTSREELALWQRAADILLMPFPRKAHYEYHMSPLKTFEYMASGVPIIASDLPSIREILHEDAAVFCKPDDPGDLARAIRATLDDQGAATRCARNARTAAREYGWAARAARLLEVMNGSDAS